MEEEHFDFEQVTEEKEELDFNKMVLCPHCKKPIPQNATMCLYCGKEAGVSKKPGWLVGTAILLIVVFIIFFLIYM